MGKAWSELFEEAEKEIKERGLYDAVSKRIDAIMDMVLKSRINDASKVQAKGSEILMLVAAHEAVERKANERV